MTATRREKELPGWVMPAVIVAGVLLVVFLAWRALTGTSSPATGPDKEVRPGMYDFRQEAQKGNIGRRSTGSGNTP